MFDIEKTSESCQVVKVLWLINVTDIHREGSCIPTVMFIMRIKQYQYVVSCM